MLAVTTEISGTKGHVDVYGADMQVLFAFNAHRRFVADACVTEDGRYLAAVTMGQADSVFVSNVVIYDLTQEDPVADYSVPDGLVTAMTGRGDQILTVSDTCLTVGNRRKASGTYSYNDEYLREYDLGGEDFTVLLLNRYQSGSVGRLVTVDLTARRSPVWMLRRRSGTFPLRAVSLRAVRGPSGGLQPSASGLCNPARPGAHPRCSDPGGWFRSDDRCGFRRTVSAITGRIYSDVYKLFSR